MSLCHSSNSAIVQLLHSANFRELPKQPFWLSYGLLPLRGSNKYAGPLSRITYMVSNKTIPGNDPEGRLLYLPKGIVMVTSSFNNPGLVFEVSYGIKGGK